MKKSLLGLALLSAVSVAPQAMAHEAGDILVRGGITLVQPDSAKAPVYLNDEIQPLYLSVDDNYQLGLNLVYFFDSNWAVEVLAATPFTHDVNLHNGDDSAKLAEVTHLPPTVSALYYFDTGTAFKPYVGAGINYTIFFNEEFVNEDKEGGFSNLSLDSSFGYALQIGADYEINDKWHVNASARYIDIATDVTFDVAGASIGKASVDVDPMVYSLMIGYKF